jgi:hypothetical protein
MRESYTATKNLEQGASGLDSSFEEIRTFLLKLWDVWPRLHEAMRDDLGVKD